MTKLSILLRILELYKFRARIPVVVILFLFLTFRNKAKIFSDPKNKCTKIVIIISQKSGGNDCALIAKLSFFMGGAAGPNLKLFEQKLVILHIQIMFHLVSVYIDYCSVTISNPNIALCFLI